jgi:hypothetical protein
MIEASGIRGAEKKKALRAVAALSPVTEIGCMQVDFFNRASGSSDVAYLVLDRCPPGHDLGAQLDKLKRVVSEEKWPEVIRSLSMLVNIGRAVYAQTARDNIDLIRQIWGFAAEDLCTKYLDMQVDKSNTTLFLDAGWPGRVGIFVRTGAEVRAGQSLNTKEGSRQL